MSDRDPATETWHQALTAEIPEVTPERVPDDVEIWLTVNTYGERDGIPYAQAHVTDSTSTGEAKARTWLSSMGSARFAGIVKVRVPRSLLRERWTEPAR